MKAGGLLAGGRRAVPFVFNPFGILVVTSERGTRAREKFSVLGFHLFLYRENFRKNFRRFMDTWKFLLEGGRPARKLVFGAPERSGDRRPLMSSLTCHCDARRPHGFGALPMCPEVLWVTHLCSSCGYGVPTWNFIWKYGCTSEILQVQFETRVETVRG